MLLASAGPPSPRSAREMLIWDDVGDGHRLTFEGGVVAEICIESEESLNVIMGEVTVADGNDRFIPRDGAIYAYSKDGSRKRWTLPGNFRNETLQVFTLTPEGRGPAPDYNISEDIIQLSLDAGVPVKILRS